MEEKCSFTVSKTLFYYERKAVLLGSKTAFLSLSHYNLTSDSIF